MLWISGSIRKSLSFAKLSKLPRPPARSTSSRLRYCRRPPLHVSDPEMHRELVRYDIRHVWCAQLETETDTKIYLVLIGWKKTVCMMWENKQWWIDESSRRGRSWRGASPSRSKTPSSWRAWSRRWRGFLSWKRSWNASERTTPSSGQSHFWDFTGDGSDGLLLIEISTGWCSKCLFLETLV